jgi:AraC-like DNA-binding protein
MRRPELSEGSSQLEQRLAGFLQGPRATARELPADIQRVLSYIDENAFDPRVNVQRIKLRCGLRDNNVSSRFRFFMGATIRDYLESLRMDAAAFLLRQGGATVMEVAFAVGYNNLQTFYGAFRRKYTCTPDAYRRKVGCREA